MRLEILSTLNTSPATAVQVAERIGRPKHDVLTAIMKMHEAKDIERVGTNKDHNGIFLSYTYGVKQ